MYFCILGYGRQQIGHENRRLKVVTALSLIARSFPSHGRIALEDTMYDKKKKKKNKREWRRRKEESFGRHDIRRFSQSATNLTPNAILGDLKYRKEKRIRGERSAAII